MITRRAVLSGAAAAVAAIATKPISVLAEAAQVPGRVTNPARLFGF